jgi:hypothetical protein
MCFIVHKTTSELEHAILTTLYLADAKNTNNCIIQVCELSVNKGIVSMTNFHTCTTCCVCHLNAIIHVLDCELVKFTYNVACGS